MPNFDYRMGELAFGMSNTYSGILVALSRARLKRDERLEKGDDFVFSMKEFMPNSCPYVDLEGRVLAPKDMDLSRLTNNPVFYLGFSINLYYCTLSGESVDKRNTFAHLLSKKMGEFTADDIGSGLLLSPINGLKDSEFSMHIPGGISRREAKELIKNFAISYAKQSQSGGWYSPSSTLPQIGQKRTPQQRFAGLFGIASLIR